MERDEKLAGFALPVWSVSRVKTKILPSRWLHCSYQVAASAATPSSTPAGMDQENPNFNKTSFTFQFASTEQQGAPVSAGNEADHGLRQQQSAAASLSSSRESRKKVEAARSEMDTSSEKSLSAYPKEKRDAFHLDRVATWAAGIVVVASLAVCLIAIFVTSYDDVATTTLGTPIKTEDPLLRLSAWERRDIKLVYGRTPTPPADVVTPKKSNIMDITNATDIIRETFSEVDLDNSTVVDRETMSTLTGDVIEPDYNGTATASQNFTLDSSEGPQNFSGDASEGAFLVDEQQHRLKNNG